MYVLEVLDHRQLKPLLELTRRLPWILLYKCVCCCSISRDIIYDGLN